MPKHEWNTRKYSKCGISEGKHLPRKEKVTLYLPDPNALSNWCNNLLGFRLSPLSDVIDGEVFGSTYFSQMLISRVDASMYTLSDVSKNSIATTSFCASRSDLPTLPPGGKTLFNLRLWVVLHAINEMMDFKEVKQPVREWSNDGKWWKLNIRNRCTMASILAGTISRR